jgi:hypothetical protein
LVVYLRLSIVCFDIPDEPLDRYRDIGAEDAGGGGRTFSDRGRGDRRELEEDLLLWREAVDDPAECVDPVPVVPSSE